MSFDWMRLWPKYWVQNEPTNNEWDAILSDLLDKHGAVYIDEYTAKVGPLEVWTQNWPYSYGWPRNPQVMALPKVSTRIRLRNEISKTTPGLLDEVKKAIEKS